MDIDFHIGDYDPEDLVIDSQGAVFRLVRDNPKDLFGFQATGESYQFETLREEIMGFLDVISDRPSRLEVKAQIFRVSETKDLIQLVERLGI